MRDADEACDGEDHGGLTCQSHGLAGTLRCTPWCTLDLSECGERATCGDGTRDGTEPCEGEDLGQSTCRGLGFASGQLRCNDDCTLDVSGCSHCGDGNIGAAEMCEPARAIRSTCADFNLGDGVLSCDPGRCHFDFGACSQAPPLACGDGLVTPDEACEGDVEIPCADLGRAGDSARCDPDLCTWDDRACTPLPQSRADCDACIEDHCADPLAACNANPGCRNALSCVQARCARAPLAICAALCGVSVGTARQAQEADDCFVRRCGPQCLGQAPP